MPVGLVPAVVITCLETHGTLSPCLRTRALLACPGLDGDVRLHQAAGVGITIRPARPDDGDALQDIELRAGERFREVGLDAIADHDPASLESLARYAAAGRSWVAADGPDGIPVGYVLVDVVDGAAHVEQISVLPDRQGRGIGQLLLDQVSAWAAATGRQAVTLTTFTHVPWNRPLYEHLGFRVLADAEIGPELRALRDVEAAHGLDPALRVCMRLDR